jgi:Uma2 family endonuclease
MRLGSVTRRMLPDDLLSHQRRAEHIMVMPAMERRRWTASEVRQLIADNPLQTPRYELVDGELLVTPSPIPRHQRAVTLLASVLEQYVERNPVGVVYVSPSDVELEPGEIVQPDVFVVPMQEARRIQEAWPARELLVAAEVLSPSTSRGDKVKKRPLYGRHVPEYWIFDLDARIVERWQQHAGQPQVVVSALEWQPAGASDLFRLDLASFFASVFMERTPADG